MNNIIRELHLAHALLISLNYQASANTILRAIAEIDILRGDGESEDAPLPCVDPILARAMGRTLADEPTAAGVPVRGER